MEYLLPEASYFQKFVEEEKKSLNLFERLSKISYRILRLNCPPSMKKAWSDYIFLSGLKANENEIFSLFVFSLIISTLIFQPISMIDIPSSLIFLIFIPFIAYNVYTFPKFYADVIRIRAGNEMVSIILYMVSYLSLSPVYEKAVSFAAYRCHGPLGKDFKKVMWYVLSGECKNVKEALGRFSRKWSLWSEEFVETLILLQLVELQPNPEKREEIMKVAVEKIMKSMISRMENYAISLKQPMLLILFGGILLPLLALVAFPLISIFLSSIRTINSTYIAIGYDVILPFFLWYFLYRIISKRPSTYSHSEKIEEVQPDKYLKIGKLHMPLLPLAILLTFTIAIPAIFYLLYIGGVYMTLKNENPHPLKLQEAWAQFLKRIYEDPNVTLYHAFQAMFLIWAIGIGIIFYTFFRVRRPFKLYIFIKDLEKDFQDGLFELHEALNRNMPIEMALVKVLEHYERIGKSNSPMAIFFKEVRDIILVKGLSIGEALFGKEGILWKLPSSLIKNIMGIVSSALKRSPVLASKISRDIVYYLSRIAEVEDLIKKITTDITSQLEMTGKLITPIMSSIIASSAVIIIQMLILLSKILSLIELYANLGTGVGVAIETNLKLLDFKKVFPPSFLEIVAGIYMIEITIIVSYFLTGISRGFDTMYRDKTIYTFLSLALIIFTLVFFVMLLFFKPVFETIIGRMYS